MSSKITYFDLRVELLKAMRRQLEAEGLDGLEVRKIVKVAGCSVGTFYNYYKGLDDLIIHFNGETLDTLKICIFDTITSQDNAREIIRKICQNYINFAKNRHSEWLLLLEYPIKAPLPTWYQDKVDQLFQKVSLTFHPILRGQKVDADKSVKVLWGSLHGICSLILKQKLRFSKEQDTLELCQELFHNYILGYRIGIGII